ncbi:DUF6731 family protein [Lentibacillus sp. Marseille-P4043]|uniref:DUF6731 family protein n=1 Tax=Lentibacillus sp. Marseille-P4043 TaxID=2040293 RepID=UPI000D0B251E|nr:DUF6731 family protein [Lentibacillus sp. Marseille-P4043]
MASKKIKYDFFLVKYLEGNTDIFNNKLTGEYAKANKTEVELAKTVLRIGALNKIKRNESFATMENNYVWVAAIERINTDEESYVGKRGESSRKTYAADPDEGPLNDTVFLYDPQTGVIIVQRNRGGVSLNAMLNFIIAICHSEKIDLEIMIDPKILDKLDKIPLIKSIEYSVAKPTDLSDHKNKDRTTGGDIRLANKLKANKLKVVLGADKGEYLERSSAIKKVKSIIHSKSDVGVMKVNGFHGDVEETLDLVNQRIVHAETVKAGRGKKVNYINIMSNIERAFRKKYKAISDFTKKDRV